MGCVLNVWWWYLNDTQFTCYISQDNIIKSLKKKLLKVNDTKARGYIVWITSVILLLKYLRVIYCFLTLIMLKQVLVVHKDTDFAGEMVYFCPQRWIFAPSQCLGMMQMGNKYICMFPHWSSALHGLEIAWLFIWLFQNSLSSNHLMTIYPSHGTSG